MNRRRHDRSETLTRESLERSLESWRRLLSAWGSVSELAKEVENLERLSLAASKLSQCQEEIERLENLLYAAESHE